MDSVFFINTYVDYHTNGTNRAYWAKFFRLIKEYTGDEKKMHLYSSFNENMPIYEYYSEKRSRFVRIMQYNPKNELVLEEKYPAKRLFTAWIDQRSQPGENDVMIPELVVCLLMTWENIRKAEDLIRDWFAGRDNIVNERIERIYEDQARMDGEYKDDNR